MIQGIPAASAIGNPAIIAHIVQFCDIKEAVLLERVCKSFAPKSYRLRLWLNSLNVWFPGSGTPMPRDFEISQYHYQNILRNQFIESIGNASSHIQAFVASRTKLGYFGGKKLLSTSGNLGEIFRDVRRTFPIHEFFNNPNGIGQHMLTNVLIALLKSNTETGYCQGMNFVAGALLICISRLYLNSAEYDLIIRVPMEVDSVRSFLIRETYIPKPEVADDSKDTSNDKDCSEEEVQFDWYCPDESFSALFEIEHAVFLMMVSIMKAKRIDSPHRWWTDNISERRTSAAHGVSAGIGTSMASTIPCKCCDADKLGMSEVWRPGVPRMRQRVFQLDMLLRRCIPRLYFHFDSTIELNPDALISQWFITLFSYSLPLHSLFRVWDFVFAHGWSSIFRFALGILLLEEEHLLTLDLEGFSDYLRENRKKSLNSGSSELARNSASSILSAASPIRINKQMLWASRESFAVALFREHFITRRNAADDTGWLMRFGNENFALDDELIEDVFIDLVMKQGDDSIDSQVALDFKCKLAQAQEQVKPFIEERDHFRRNIMASLSGLQSMLQGRCEFVKQLEGIVDRTSREVGVPRDLLASRFLNDYRYFSSSSGRYNRVMDSSRSRRTSEASAVSTSSDNAQPNPSPPIPEKQREEHDDDDDDAENGAGSKPNRPLESELFTFDNDGESDDDDADDDVEDEKANQDENCNNSHNDDNASLRQSLSSPVSSTPGGIKDRIKIRLERMSDTIKGSFSRTSNRSQPSKPQEVTQEEAARSVSGSVVSQNLTSFVSKIVTPPTAVVTSPRHKRKNVFDPRRHRDSGNGSDNQVDDDDDGRNDEVASGAASSLISSLPSLLSSMVSPDASSSHRPRSKLKLSKHMKEDELKLVMKEVKQYQAQIDKIDGEVDELRESINSSLNQLKYHDETCDLLQCANSEYYSSLLQAIQSIDDRIRQRINQFDE